MKALRLIWVGIMLTSCVLAQVNKSNGNYYVSYEDLTLNGSEWSVERNYNSLSTENVLFGPGWGSNVATGLWPLPDGQLLVIYFGIGSRERFLPMKLNRTGIYQMIDTIIEYEIGMNRLQRSPTNIIRRRSELIADGSARASKYVDAIRKNSSFLTQAINPISTLWVNEYRESEKIVWESDRYHLTQYKNEIYFDRTGRMIRYKNDANDVSFEYDLSRRLTKIKGGKDSIGVIQNSEGHILSLSTLDSAGMIKDARYTYDSAGLLIRSIDAGDNRYDYEYDRNKNMTFIRYSDGTYRRIEYDPATNRTISLRQRNGDSSRYEYGYKYLADGRLNLDHFYTRIINYDSIGKRVFGSYWETEFRLKEDGDSYRYLMYEKNDTSESLYLYPTNVGNIIYGKVNAREAWQDYDLKTRPIYLRVKDSVFTTRYNVMGLPDRFQAIDSIKRDTLTFQYFYSAQGQLNRVVRNRTTYLIAGTVESDKVVLTQGDRKWEIGFSKGKPIYFIDQAGGRLAVSELDTPDQAENKKMFQDLLPLTRVQRIEHEWIWERL